MFRAKNRHYNIPGLKIKKDEKISHPFAFNIYFSSQSLLCYLKAEFDKLYRYRNYRQYQAFYLFIQR